MVRQGAPEADGRGGLTPLELMVSTCLWARDGQRVVLPLDY